MNKNLKVYLFVLVIVIALMTLLQMDQKPLIDWRKSYSVEKETPFGLYIFDHEADVLFDNQIERVGILPYKYYSGDSLSAPHNILIVEEYIDKESWVKILREVYRGSTALHIARQMHSYVERELNVKSKKEFYDPALKFGFVDTQLDAEILIDKLPDGIVFYKIPGISGEIIGEVSSEKVAGLYTNMVKIKYGRGEIYLHSAPIFLTNYYLLKEGNAAYAEQVFSVLPKGRKTLWFTEREGIQNTSILRVVADNVSLRYAWYLFLIGLFLYVFFTAKRRQRIVPIIKPPENSSVEFVRNIGNLYFNEGDVREMMEKKTTYFLNRVRTELLIDTRDIDEKFAEKLHIKTNVSSSLIQDAMRLIQKMEDTQTGVEKEDLIKLNEVLDKIYK